MQYHLDRRWNWTRYKLDTRAAWLGVNAFCNKLRRGFNVSLSLCVCANVPCLRQDNCRNCHRVEGFIRTWSGDSNGTHLGVVPAPAAAVLTFLQRLLKRHKCWQMLLRVQTWAATAAAIDKNTNFISFYVSNLCWLVFRVGPHLYMLRNLFQVVSQNIFPAVATR